MHGNGTGTAVVCSPRVGGAHLCTFAGCWRVLQTYDADYFLHNLCMNFELIFKKKHKLVVHSLIFY